VHYIAWDVSQREFARHFGDFKKLSPQFDVLAAPFNTEYENAPDALQLELIDLQCDLQARSSKINSSNHNG